MLRICRKCGNRYEGDPGSTLCQACVRIQKSSTIRDRACRNCGSIFPGGPRAWYCPACRSERQAIQAREYHQRKKAGNTRTLGSTDLCSICEQPYVVTSGNQKYCPKCAPDAIREIDRAQATVWFAQNTSPATRRAQKKASTAEIPCKICGKLFKPHNVSKTCSPECSTALTKLNSAAWESTHKQQRNQYHRELAKTKKENNT